MSHSVALFAIFQTFTDFNLVPTDLISSFILFTIYSTYLTRYPNFDRTTSYLLIYFYRSCVHMEFKAFCNWLFWTFLWTFLPLWSLPWWGGVACVFQWPWRLCWLELCLLVRPPMSDRQRGRNQTKSVYWLWYAGTQ